MGHQDSGPGTDPEAWQCPDSDEDRRHVRKTLRGGFGNLDDHRTCDETAQAAGESRRRNRTRRAGPCPGPHNATMELLRPVDGNFDAANDTRFDVSHTSVPPAIFATIEANVVGHGPVPR